MHSFALVPWASAAEDCRKIIEQCHIGITNLQGVLWPPDCRKSPLDLVPTKVWVGGKMDLKRTSVVSTGFLGVLFLMLPGSLRAGSILKYTGKPYTFCQYAYTCTGTTPSLSFTLDTTLTGAQLDNLTMGTVAGGNLSAFVTSFTLTDGFQVNITKANAAFWDFDVTTGANGSITSWYIIAFTNGTPGASNYVGGTCNVIVSSPFACHDTDSTDVQINGISYSAYGRNSADPGTWAVTTPEPSSLLLLGTSLLGLAPFRRKLFGR
jgi:hypothetical protein